MYVGKENLRTIEGDDIMAKKNSWVRMAIKKLNIRIRPNGVRINSQNHQIPSSGHTQLPRNIILHVKKKGERRLS